MDVRSDHIKKLRIK